MAQTIENCSSISKNNIKIDNSVENSHESDIIAESLAIFEAGYTNTDKCVDNQDETISIPGEIICDQNYLDISSITKLTSARKLQFKTLAIDEKLSTDNYNMKNETEKKSGVEASLAENETSVLQFELDASFNYDIYCHKSKFF
jgi:hypothetical protein